MFCLLLRRGPRTENYNAAIQWSLSFFSAPKIDWLSSDDLSLCFLNQNQHTFVAWCLSLCRKRYWLKSAKFPRMSLSVWVSIYIFLPRDIQLLSQLQYPALLLNFNINFNTRLQYSTSILNVYSQPQINVPKGRSVPAMSGFGWLKQYNLLLMSAAPLSPKTR